MSNLKQDASHPKAHSDKTSDKTGSDKTWTDVQAYLLAVVCLYWESRSATCFAVPPRRPPAESRCLPLPTAACRRVSQVRVNLIKPNQASPSGRNLSRLPNNRRRWWTRRLRLCLRL